MAEQQTTEINSHGDIEALVRNWDGFILGENFMDESGFCTTGGSDTGDRKSLREPHESSGQIYRFLKGDYIEDSHRYALITANGEVILSARLDFEFGERHFFGSYIEHFVKKYSELKRNLEEAGVSYIPDTEFENLIIESARILSG